MTLNEAILLIVKNNSGGVKFTELITDLVCMNAEGDISDITVAYEFVDLIEKKCKDMTEVKLLEYAMPMGNGLERLKMFVYIPLS